MIGPRQELPCGCVLDTLDGERRFLVRCIEHAMAEGWLGLFVFLCHPTMANQLAMLQQPVVRFTCEPLMWHLDENEQLVGPFASDGSPR